MNLRAMRERLRKAENAVNCTFEPTRAQWNEFDDAAKAVYDAEQYERELVAAADRLAAIRAAERREQEMQDAEEKRLTARRKNLLIARITAVVMTNAMQEGDA